MSIESQPIERLQTPNPLELLQSIADIRGETQEYRKAYLESLKIMKLLCRELRGVELKITGRLQDRDGTVVYHYNPDSFVEDLHVRIGSARVETYVNHGNPAAEHLPFINFTAWTIETDEMVTAWLGAGDFGVTAKVVESPVQA